MGNIHPLILLIDYVLGVVMWTLIGRVAMNIFQREDSEFFFMKVFVKLTNPIIRPFKIITPSFIGSYVDSNWKSCDEHLSEGRFRIFLYESIC